MNDLMYLNEKLLMRESSWKIIQCVENLKSKKDSKRKRKQNSMISYYEFSLK